MAKTITTSFSGPIWNVRQEIVAWAFAVGRENPDADQCSVTIAANAVKAAAGALSTRDLDGNASVGVSVSIVINEDGSGSVSVGLSHGATTPVKVPTA
jgi:hypothetical protein